MGLRSNKHAKHEKSPNNKYLLPALKPHTIDEVSWVRGVLFTSLLVHQIHSMKINLYNWFENMQTILLVLANSNNFLDKVVKHHPGRDSRVVQGLRIDLGCGEHLLGHIRSRHTFNDISFNYEGNRGNSMKWF